MPKGKTARQLSEDQGFMLADDYTEEYKEAKVTLVEEEQETFDLGEKEASTSLTVTEPYYRKKQPKRLNLSDVEEISGRGNQPGLLVRRLKKNA